MSRRLAAVSRLRGFPALPTKPVMSSLRKTDSLQWESRVPGPPVFSTGTAVGRLPPPRRMPYSLMALAPTKVGLAVPRPVDRRPLCQDEDPADQLAVDHDAGHAADDHPRPAIGRIPEGILLSLG